MSHPWDDKWNLGKRLGKGGQGLTQLATPIGDGPPNAAVKMLKNNQDRQARGRMFREVASLQVLASAGGSVPHVLDHNTSAYEDLAVELYLAMEYVPGLTLREIIEERRRLPLDLAKRVVLKLCETIELAHSYQILHRDLKPENIIARDLEAGDAVIVDYGLSFNAESPDVTITEETFRNRFLDLPETNTPGGNRRDTRSDITAACAIFYYLLTGHVPGHLQDGNGRPPHLRPGYSLREAIGDVLQIAQLELLFNRGFAPSADNRFQTVSEFRERLLAATVEQTQVQIEDPIEVARQAATQLRQSDRVTQLVELRKPCKELVAKLRKVVAAFENKLDRFSLSLSGVSAGKSDTPGFEWVQVEGIKAALVPHSHNYSRTIEFLIGARGEQCVLMFRTFNGKEGIHKIMGDWTELLWFDADTPADVDVFSAHVCTWLNKSLRELVQEVLASSS